MTVIDDFAHHPTAVEETLKALRMKYDGKRLIAVFEPRSWSSRLAHIPGTLRQGLFLRRLRHHRRRLQHLESQRTRQGARCRRARRDIELQGKPAMAFPDADAIVDHLAPELRDGDVVAIMSNGGFGGIHEKLLNILKA